MKTKFNIIDAIVSVIIIAVIAVGVFAYFKFANKDTAVADTTKINFVVEVNNITEESSKSFMNVKGESVTFGSSSSGVGTVKNVEVVPYVRWTKNTEDGEYIITEVPGRYTANVTIESDVAKSDVSFTSGSETVAVGKKMPFNSKGAAFEEGYIVDLLEVE